MSTYLIIMLMLSATAVYGLSGEKKSVVPKENQKS
jgi:hypothetical protein